MFSNFSLFCFQKRDKENDTKQANAFHLDILCLFFFEGRVFCLPHNHLHLIHIFSSGSLHKRWCQGWCKNSLLLGSLFIYVVSVLISAFTYTFEYYSFPFLCCHYISWASCIVGAVNFSHPFLSPFFYKKLGSSFV